MPFARRQIDVRFDLDTAAFPDGSTSLTLTGYRVQATISTVQGAGSLAVNSLALRIYGMKLADMNTLSVWQPVSSTLSNNQITVSAGNVGTPLNVAFAGTIFSAVVEAGQPEMSFVVSGQGGLWTRFATAAANSWPGTQDVASIIGGLAKQAGFAFRNHCVTAKLSGQYASGTVLDQIERVATASQTIVLLDDSNTVHIWPSGDVPDFPEVSLAAGTGLIGYPKFNDYGIHVKAEWNPLFLYGTLANIESLIPMANGKWMIGRAVHDLSTLAPGGPWFSELDLYLQGWGNARRN